MIDCHAHLAAEAFDGDREEVCRRAAAAGVRAIVVVGEGGEDNDRVLCVTREVGVRPGHGVVLVPCLGFHPDRFSETRPAPTREELDAFVASVREHAGELAGIGEVGLDRWWVKADARRVAQAAFLEELVALANELDLTLNVHSRSAGGDTIEFLRAAGARRVLMHGFDGRAAHAVRGAEFGYVFSIPASVVRSEQKQMLVVRLPFEALALETDSPVLGPERGTRNEPANVRLACEHIARARGLTFDAVAEATTRTAERLFPRLTAGAD